MQRIGESPEWDNIARLISNIRTLNANARQEGKVESRPLLDHSQLTGENLEEMGVIDRGAPRLTVKALEHCGRCDEGWIRIEDTRNCVKLCPYCEIPRRKAKRLNDLELPADALDMNLRRYEWDTPQQEASSHPTTQPHRQPSTATLTEHVHVGITWQWQDLTTLQCCSMGMLQR